MSNIELHYTWAGYTFHAPSEQEVFYVTDWFPGELSKGKQSNLNKDFECLWRIVDTGNRITRNVDSPSTVSTNDNSDSCQNIGLKAQNQGISDYSGTGSQAPMGSPESPLTPTPSGKLMELTSLQRIRSDKSRLAIAFDTEFFYETSAKDKVVDPKAKKVKKENGARNITSYQLALYLGDEVHVLEVVFLVKPTYKPDGTVVYKRLMLSQCLGTILDLCTLQKNHVFDYKDTRRWPVAIKNQDGTVVKEILFKSPEEALSASGTLKQSYADCVVDTSNVSAKVYKNIYSEYMGERAIRITVLSHAGIVDLSAFAPERGNRSIMKLTTSVQNGLVSTDEHFFRAVHKDYWRFYPCMVTFRDTMCYAVPKKKKLSILGETLNIPKIELPDGAISNMGEFLKTNRNEYLEYSANDALITLCYASKMWGVNREMPLTASAAAARGAYESIKDYLGVHSKQDYQLAYGGLKKVIKGKVPMENRPSYMEVSNLEPYDHRAFLLLNAAAFSYKGGFNTCTQVGWYDSEDYFDYDLKNAYPTSMCNVFDVDFKDGIDPLAYDPICNKELTLADFDSPYDPLFAYISFEFPVGTKYPCIPISCEGSLLFPRTSDGFEGVYACGPDIYLALKMGAKVHCLDGYRGRIRQNEDGSPSRSLGAAVYQLVQDRAKAREIYGKKSIEELILKVMVNSIYGKTAQNVIQKHTWDGLTQEYQDLGMSIITCPVHSAITTAGVRCVLIAAMTQLESLGYKVWSVTTDGFISNAPIDVLAGLDLFGFADVFKSARRYLTNGKSDTMWEAKHSMNRFLNLSTRANVSPDEDGVCAHGGLHTQFVADSLEDRADYIEKTLKREGTVPSPHDEFVNLKTMITQSCDFHTYDCVTNISFDFDMKRKPVQDSIYSIWVDTASDYQSYATEHPSCSEIACFDTVPFDSIAEYEHYRDIKNGSAVLRTSEHWKRFFLKVNTPKDSKNRIKDVAWSELMSCIIAYRTGKVTINPLDACSSLKEKLEYINQNSPCSKTFTESHWKNARRPDRASQMLPLDMIQDTLSALQNNLPVNC